MGWRYAVGSSIDSLRQWLLRNIPPNRYYPAGRCWAYDLKRLYAGHRRRPMVIIDAGANIGQTCIHLSKWFPEATIYSFEPVLATYERLRKNTRSYPKIRCIHAALGETETRAQITLIQNSELNSLNAEPMLNALVTGASEIVQVTTLRQFMASNKIDAIDILKMDVQGYELPLLRGAGDIANIGCIFAEVGLQDDGRADLTPFSELHAYLRSREFFFSGLYDAFRHWDAKMLVSFGNALYVQTSWFEAMPAAATKDQTATSSF